MIDYFKIKSENGKNDRHGIDAKAVEKRLTDKGLKRSWRPFPVYKYYNLNISIFNATTIGIDGSIHKFYNAFHNRKGGGNYDDFFIEKVSWVVVHLSKILGVDVSSFKLINLEVGVNLRMDPSSLLDSIICHRNKDVNRNISYSNGGRMIEFEWQQYYLKFYDKGAQSGLQYPLLRVEIKSMRNSHCKQNFGAEYVGDLFTDESQTKMYQCLEKKVKALMLIPDGWEYKVPKEEHDYFVRVSNPKNWDRKRKSKSKSFRYEWDKCQDKIGSYGLDFDKCKLLDLMGEKWELLSTQNTPIAHKRRKISTFYDLDKKGFLQLLKDRIWFWVVKKTKYILNLIGWNREPKVKRANLSQQSLNAQSGKEQSYSLNGKIRAYWNSGFMKMSQIVKWVSKK